MWKSSEYMNFVGLSQVWDGFKLKFLNVVAFSMSFHFLSGSRPLQKVPTLWS